MTTATANQYSLPSAATINGTFKFQLFSSIAGLTPPGIQTITSIGPVRESANIILGVSEIGNIQISLRDDDSTYSQGFWFKVLKGETWLRIYLDEGAGDTFYFFGMVDLLNSKSVSWSESYLGASTRIRIANVTLVSMARKIFDMDVDDWITEVLAQCTEIGEASSVSVPSHLMKYVDFYECMLNASGLNPDFSSAADVSLVYGASTCITWGDGVSNLRADQVWLPIKYFVSTGPDVIAPTAYFNVAGTSCLSTQSDGTGFYASMDALLKDLLFNGALQMRMDYDPATDRHKIQLMHKQKVYSGTITLGNGEKVSGISNSSRLVGDAVQSTDLLDDSKFFWISAKYQKFGSWLAPDKRVQFDIDKRLPFIINPAANGEGNHSFISWAGAGHAIVYISGVKYLSTISGLMTDASIADPLKMQEACSVHHQQAFIVDKQSILRKYKAIAADAGSGYTHTAINIMRRTSINDLDATGNYYANTVQKDAESSEVEIEWIAE